MNIFESCFDENYNYFSKDLRINFEREYPWYNKYNQYYFDALYDYGYSRLAFNNGLRFELFTEIIKHLLLLCCSDPNVLLVELASLVLNSKECDATWISNFYQSFRIYFITHEIVEPKKVAINKSANDNKNSCISHVAEDEHSSNDNYNSNKNINNVNENKSCLYFNCNHNECGFKSALIYVPNNNINGMYQYTIKSHKLSCCWYWQLTDFISCYRNDPSMS